MDEKETVHISIPVSTKLVAAAVTALVIAFGAYPVANRFNTDARHDPFSGTDGQRLEDRLEVLELTVSRCQRGNSEHRELQASELATIRAKTISNYDLISRCLRITGQ